MRTRTYLFALLLVMSAAVYFARHGEPVWAVLVVIPGYFVVSYLLILISTFLPGSEKRRFEAARNAAFSATPAIPADTTMHPAFMGSMLETMYTGEGFVGWPEHGHLVFRAPIHPNATFQYPPNAFRGFKVEDEAPSFLIGTSLANAEHGPLVVLDGGPSAGMVRLWVQPSDASSFADRLRSAGIPSLD